MKATKIVMIGVLGLGILVGIAFALELLGLEWTRYFSPKKEAVRRDVFEETRSFNEAKKQELIKYRMEYLRAKDKDEKEAIASTIRMAFADYDEDKLQPELRQFLKEMKYR